MGLKTAGRQKLVKLIIYIVLLLGAALVSRYSQTPQNPGILGTDNTPLPPGYYRVLEFYDGDTISVDMDGNAEKVRFVGVDTPETKHPSKPVECFGEAASAFTKELVGGNPVRLEADPLSSNRDRYDRLLRYVYLPDGRLVNLAIVEQGYGHAYIAFEFSKMDEFVAAQDRARESNRGLWSSCPATISARLNVPARL